MSLMLAKYLKLGNGVHADADGALATWLKENGGIVFLTLEMLADPLSQYYIAEESERAQHVGKMAIADAGIVNAMLADGAVSVSKMTLDGDMVFELNSGVPQFTISGLRNPVADSDAVNLTYLNSRLAGLAGDLTLSVAQAGHGLSSGDFIRHNGTAWVKAQADSAENTATHVAQVSDIDNFVASSIGEISLSGILDDVGDALVAGEFYYLSPTVAGKVSRVIPAVGQVAQVVLKVNAAGQGTIFIKQPIVVAEFEANWGAIGGDILDQADLQNQFAVTRDSIEYLALHVTQAGHGIVGSGFVFHNGISWVKAQANNVATAATHFAIVKDIDNLKLIQVGDVASAGILDDQGAALIDGDYYFLSATVAGGITSTVPGVGNVSQPVLKVNGSKVSILIKQPTVVAEFSAIWGDIGGSLENQADLEAIVANFEAVIGANRDEPTLGEFAVDHPLNDLNVKQALAALQLAIEGVESGAGGDLAALYGRLGLEEDGTLNTAFPAFGAEDVQVSFAESIRILLANALHKDGSVAMTGDLDMGSKNIVNLAEPTADNHATTKLYVDTKVADEIKALTDGFVWKNEVVGVYADAEAAVAAGLDIGDRFIIEEGVKGSDGSVDPEYNAFIHIITDAGVGTEASSLVDQLSNGDIVPLRDLDENGAKKAFLKTLNNSSIIRFESTTVSGSDIVLTGQNITIVIEHIPVSYTLDVDSVHSVGSISQHLEGIDAAIGAVQEALGGSGGSSVSDRLDDLETFQASAEDRLDDLEANSSGAVKYVYRKITAGEMAAGFLTIAVPAGMMVVPESVRVHPVGGIEIYGREHEGRAAAGMDFQFAVVAEPDVEIDPTKKDLKLYIDEVVGESDSLTKILDIDEVIRVAYSIVVLA